MKVRLSKEMTRSIDEMKQEALILIQDIPPMQALKIKRNVTKNKTFEFQVINLGRPAIKVYINERFFKSYIYSDNKWTED